MLLTSDIAQTIYSSIKGEPIIDYHTHLPATEILSNHRFADLWELWLKYDHYKWRLMRGCGVEERFITGDATPWEKFHAFAEILPLGIGNPVYQWVHMELKAVFNIHLTLNRTTAQEVWKNANQQLENNITVGSLIKQFNVKLIGTTDDPADSLQTHIDLVEANYPAQILPTFRPDRFYNVHQADKFTQAISALSERLGTPINTFSELLSGLKQRHDDFAIAGCLMSDHGLDYCPTGHAKISELDAIMAAALSGKAASQKEWEQFAGEIMRAVAHWNTEKDWTMQLHLGPQRGVNTRLTDITGADSGFDTMGSWQQTAPLISFLNELSHESKLPKTIVYNLNPVETEPICAALQNFQEAPLAGKVQYGAAWWMLDHVPGIQKQLETLSVQSAIGSHVGMLTDSRSFTSFVRHDYYRRILCNFLADKVSTGEMPNDIELLTTTAQNIASRNISKYLVASFN